MLKKGIDKSKLEEKNNSLFGPFYQSPRVGLPL
jgi:hypothetical protein